MTTQTAAYTIDDAEPLWLAGMPPAWGDVVRVVPEEASDAASMIAAAGLDWRVERHPLEAVVEREYQCVRVRAPRHVATVRSDTGAVLGVVGDGYEPLQNAAAFAFCDTITDSGRAHWIGGGATHGGSRVHALMRLDRKIRIGGAEGEDVLPLLCFRNGHDGGLAVTISVLPFRLACLNGMLLPVEGAERTWKARHTANVEAKLADARRTLGIAWRYYDQLERLGDRLIRERLDAGAFEGGVDASALAASTPYDRRSALLRDFFDLCLREFAADRGAPARAYLEHRGLPSAGIQEAGLGVVPPSAVTLRVLRQAGYRPEEIAAAGVVADARWPGRLCGAWRDTNGKIGTLWARAVDDGDVSEARYLYLRGASRANLPPYGLSDALDHPPEARREVVLVEGLLDVHQLRAHGVAHAAALGGTSMAANVFERLHRLGVEAVTLCFDNDDAGRAATTRAVENSVRARSSPDLYVVDPARLGAASDPDEYVSRLGPSRWRDLLEGRSCGIVWRARDIAAATRDEPASVRRIALARAGRWLGALPPRLAVEQEDALRAVADTCGYSAPAVERAFRARFWREPPRRDLAELSR
jgi:phage/plasmid-like protein (TIGR03299 family)